MEITERALTRTPPAEAVAEELRLETVEWCLSRGCTRRASRQDGLCARHSRFVLTTQEQKRRATERMERDADVYRRLQLKAAHIAAADGDAGPAQWALERIGVVKPLPKDTGGHGGLTVNVGIALPGLGL